MLCIFGNLQRTFWDHIAQGLKVITEHQAPENALTFTLYKSINPTTRITMGNTVNCTCPVQTLQKLHFNVCIIRGTTNTPPHLTAMCVMSAVHNSSYVYDYKQVADITQMHVEWRFVWRCLLPFPPARCMLKCMSHNIGTRLPHLHCDVGGCKVLHRSPEATLPGCQKNQVSLWQ